METHTIPYEGVEIEYHLIRKKVKYINLRVNKEEQVVVSAPKQVPFSVIEEFVLSKAQWIITHLAEMEKIRLSKPSTAIYSGKTIYLLGKPYTLILKSGKKDFFINANALHMTTINMEQKSLHKEYLEWLRAFAKETFPKLLDEVYPLVKPYHIPYPEIHIRDMSSIWGSCTVGQARIRLNLQLIKKDPDCIKEVILHELIHFLHPNHGKEFYALLTELMPDWKERKMRLETMYKDGI